MIRTYAVVRKNGVLKLFEDGVLVQSWEATNEVSYVEEPLLIGVQDVSEAGGSIGFGGYLSHFHFVKGRALHEADYTVSDITSVAETKLLLKALTQDVALVDSSSSPKVVSNTNVTWRENINPFSLSSYDSTFNTGDPLDIAPFAVSTAGPDINFDIISFTPSTLIPGLTFGLFGSTMLKISGTPTTPGDYSGTLTVLIEGTGGVATVSVAGSYNITVV